MISSQFRLPLRVVALVLAPCIAALMACSEAESPTKSIDTPPVVVQGTVGPLGGTIGGAGDPFKLVFPPSAVGSGVLVSVVRDNDAPGDSRVVLGTVVDISAGGAALFRSATLTLSYDPKKIPVGMAESSLRLARLHPHGWTFDGEIETGIVVDTVNNTVTSPISSFGTYALRSVPVDRIQFSGASVDGALYVGQSATASLIMSRLAYSDVFIGSALRPVKWAISAPQVASVDANGKFTGLASGSATITATVEGISATTTLTVLPRPTANWTQATDWTTYQGNPRRNGFNSVTADPVIFSERWARTPDAATVTFHQATASENRVYLVTQDGKRQIIALSAADGSTQWSKSFGSVNYSNQATYDNGTLFLTVDGAQYLLALNATDGATRFSVPFQGQRTATGAPLVTNTTVITAATIGSDGLLYGYDRNTGAPVFDRTYLANASGGRWSPAFLSGRIYTTIGGVTAIDPLNGSILDQITDPRVQIATTPIVGSINNILTVSQSRLASVDLTTRSVKWDRRADNNVVPVVGNGVVYASDSAEVVARNETDGATLWRWSAPAPFSTIASMALTQNLLFVSVTTGEPTDGYTIALDLATHRPVWSYRTPGLLSLNGDGTLYIVQLNKIAAVNLR